MNRENSLPKEVLEAEVECLRKELKIAFAEIEKLKMIIKGDNNDIETIQKNTRTER